MRGIRKAWKVTFNFFDKFEDKVRFHLSRRPILYAIVGAIGVALLWKGVDDIALQFGINGLYALALGLALMLATGLLVSFFIGDSIIISGLNREKKIVDKTELDLVQDQVKMDKITTELKHIEHELDDMRKHSQSPHIRL